MTRFQELMKKEYPNLPARIVGPRLPSKRRGYWVNRLHVQRGPEYLTTLALMVKGKQLLERKDNQSGESTQDY